MKKDMNGTYIKNAVKKRYAGLIKNDIPSCCCDSTNCKSLQKNHIDIKLVDFADYSDKELASIPVDAVKNSFGCGNPLAFADIKNGQTVLDIGSGAGIDCFLAAEQVGKTGKVIGLDMTPEMIKKAEENAQVGHYTKVEFRLGDAENMPVEDASIDWVISNCVINLSPNKQQVFKEIARVLKPGGHFSIWDIVLGNDLPEIIVNNIKAWTGCIAGAVTEEKYLAGLHQAGLVDVIVESRIHYDSNVLRFLLNNDESSSKIEDLLQKLNDMIWSAKIKGKKPLLH